MHNPEERVMVNVLAAVIIQFVICTFPAAILSIIYMNKASYDPVSFSIFRAFANNMVIIWPKNIQLLFDSLLGNRLCRFNLLSNQTYVAGIG